MYTGHASPVLVKPSKCETEMRTHKASNSERTILNQLRVIILEKDTEKPEVVCAMLWALKRLNILWIFTDMQLKILHSLKSGA